jgi:hypothetical protein
MRKERNTTVREMRDDVYMYNCTIIDEQRYVPPPKITNERSNFNSSHSKPLALIVQSQLFLNASLWVAWG